MTSRLLSVNVGRPREIEWEGTTVRTAIWKEPVDGPRMVRRINVDGDDQADRLAHRGEHRAVFVYQVESYRYWERELGRDDFTYDEAPLEPPPDGRVLVCCSRPTSELAWTCEAQSPLISAAVRARSGIRS